MKALKTIVIWLLLTVIPLQGMAVNVVMACGAARTAVVQDIFPDEVMAQVHHSQHAQHAGMIKADMADWPDTDGACDPGHAKSPGASCASFCPLAMWMPVADMTLPVVANTSIRISYIAFHVPFVIPDGPEHPPRFLSL